LGLGYLATAVRRAGHQVEIVDTSSETLSTLESFAMYISRLECDCIGLKIYSLEIPPAKEFIEIIRKVKPEIPIIVGGPHPSAMGKEIFDDFPHIDFSFVGEAEIGLPLLLNRLSNPNAMTFKEIPGLVWRENGAVYSNEPVFVQNLDELGMPAWDLLHPEKVPGQEIATENEATRYMPVMTSRGCPYHCTFCGAHLIHGYKMRYHSVDFVVNQFRYLKENYGSTDFFIVDDNFTFDGDFAKAVCRGIIDQKLDIRLDLSGNGLQLNRLDAELIRLLEQAGCAYVTLAIESGSPHILKDMRKPINLAHVNKAISLIRENSEICINAFFILGYPTETREDILRTIDYACSLDLDNVEFFLFTPLPKTEITERLIREGKLNDVDYNTYHYKEASIPIEGVTMEELQNLLVEGTYRFFARPLRRSYDKYPLMRAVLEEMHTAAERYFRMKRIVEKVKKATIPQS
jgi:radical SAM superfamily enzyme YgiQ (UPF0313 family)